MASRLRDIAAFSGTTLLGDGSVIMIIDPNGIAKAVGVGARHGVLRAQAEVDEARDAEPVDLVSLLVFRAGSPQPKAVPLALVTRLEEIDSEAIEYSDGGPVVQYRGGLMPLVPAGGRLREGGQPILVFADGGRHIGLAVDEIVDIAQEPLDIELACERPGVVGSAVVRGRATDIVDLGHFLPHLRGACWDGLGDFSDLGPRPGVLLVEHSPFFRNMLALVLKDAGYDVVAVDGGDAALAAMSVRAFAAVVADLDMPGIGGGALAAAAFDRSGGARPAMIALSAHPTSDAAMHARAAGFDDHIAKFDRHGLVAALKAHAEDTARLKEPA